MGEPGSTTARLEAFSDGVIAIAITLLILEVKIPHVRAARLAHALGEQWPSYVAYALTFVVIGIMWMNHHRVFELIGRTDRGLLFVNLMMLMGIAFLPFPTALLADYVVDGGNNATVAAAVYSATMTVIGLTFLGIWLYLRRHPELLAPGVDPVVIPGSIRRTLPGPCLYGASIALAFVSPEACLLVYALLAAYFAVNWLPDWLVGHERTAA
jgi:uncharacterized membrane protein